MATVGADRPRLPDLLAEVRACRLCAEHLPEGPRPVLQAGEGARIVVIGQAPGRRVHASGVPWDDPSGRRLRAWLGVADEEFYDPDLVALLPMGFCFPGSGRSGDLPPRPECAPQWHPPVLELLPHAGLRILIGRYAVDRYADPAGASLADVVRASFRGGDQLVLPHPSPRNQRWLRAHPWFEDELLPGLRVRVRTALAADG